jgi:Tol biopolymer transport system component
MSPTVSPLARAAVAAVLVLSLAGCRDGDMPTAPEPTPPLEAAPGPPQPLHQIAFAGWLGVADGTPSSAGYQIYAISQNGTGLAQLTNSASHDPHEPVWSPASTYLQSKIAFHLYRGGSEESANYLYVMGPSGSNQIGLTPTGYHDIQFQSWSPNRSKLVFVEKTAADVFGDDFYNSAPEYLTVVNADGSGLVHIAQDSIHVGRPAWSPDGQWIAYYAYTDSPRTRLDESGIYLIHPDGSGKTRIASSPRDYYTDVQFSPGGQRLAVAGGHDLRVMNPNGSGVVSIPICYYASCYNAQWSPNGTRILFDRYEGDPSPFPHYDIWTVNPDGMNPARLTYFGRNSQATWSRDGSHIAYVHTQVDAGLYSPDIWVMPSDGSSQTRLTFGMSAVEPSWGP